MSACRKLTFPDDAPSGPLVKLYEGFLEQTGSEVAAAIFALDSYRREQERAAAPVVIAPAEQGRTLLTPPEVAKQLGVDPATVISWIRSGQLKASNVGKGDQRPRYRIQPGDLDAFLTKRQPKRVLPCASRRTPRDDVTEFF